MAFIGKFSGIGCLISAADASDLVVVRLGFLGLCHLGLGP